MSYRPSSYRVKTLYEMDAWFQTEDFKKLGRLTRFIYASLLKEEVNKSLKRKGYNRLDPSSDPLTLYIHVEALESVDRALAESTFHRAVRILGWDSDNLRRDFTQHLKQLFGTWYLSDFATLERCFNVESSISDAVKRARGDLNYTV